MMSGAQSSPDPEERQIFAAGIRHRHQSLLDAINEQKRRQWNVTYYTLLIYGAGVAAIQIAPGAGVFSALLSWLATFLALLIAGAYIYFLARSDTRLEEYRNEVEQLEKEHAVEVGRSADKNEKNYGTASRDKWITIAQGAVSILAMLVAISLAWVLSPQ